MPLADWTLLNDGFTGTAIAVGSPPWSSPNVAYPANGIFNPFDVTDIDTGSPFDIAVDSSKCLVMASLGAGTIRGAHTTRPSTAVRGQIDCYARIRSGQNGPGHMGVCVLQNQQSMLPGLGGIAYALILDTIFFDNRLRLVQLTNGISGSPGGSLGATYTLLAETAPGFFGLSTNQVLRLAWESDPVRRKGTRLRVWHGLSEAALIQLWDIVYTGATAHVPTTSSGVGCIAHVATNSFISYFDIITVKGAP